MVSTCSSRLLLSLMKNHVAQMAAMVTTHPAIIPTIAPIDIAPPAFSFFGIVAFGGAVELLDTEVGAVTRSVEVVLLGTEVGVVAKSVDRQFIWIRGAKAVTDSIMVVVVIVRGSESSEVLVRTVTYGNACVKRFIVLFESHDARTFVVDVRRTEQLAPEVAELKHVYPLHSHRGTLLALVCLREYNMDRKRDTRRVETYIGQHPTAVSPSSIMNCTGHWASPLAVAVHALT